MHELSLATSLVESASNIAKKHGSSKVEKVTVAIGELSGVDQDAFSFCYPEATRGTILEESELIIQWIPLKASCLDCQKEVRPLAILLRCPDCQGGNLSLLAGKEFKLIDMEIQ